ncbi:MAG: HAMP domain-containing histidine kinase [Elusimicrobia bacterium]|nr:HAMP domain-containing histidine kinase [Elusimicrobiota bacterium]
MNETLRRLMERLLGKTEDGRLPGAPSLDGTAMEALLRLERLAQIGRMTAAFAHDARTPMHVISSALETMAAGAGGRGAARVELRAAQRSSKKLLHMLNDILDFAKGERGPIKDHTLEEAAEAALSLVETTCSKHGIAVKRLWGRTPATKFHLRAIEGVFYNVFNNAIDAMPDGGSLTVKTASNKKSFWASVRDTGGGMSPETLARLSSPGFTTKESGSGMGLYLSRQILAESGGELDFESQEGKGTTVTLRFKRKT